MFKKILFMTFISFIFLTSSGFTVIGHRGDPIKAPEETFQSFDVAFAEGAEYVELDVHLSKDNVLVVSHDSDLSRVTGQSLVISENDFSALSSLKVANGENIHSLDQVFEHYQNNPQTKFLIETKRDKNDKSKTMEEQLAKVISKYHMEDRVIFHSFSTRSISNLKELFPDIPRIFISGSLKRINFSVLENSTAVNVSSKIITPQLVSQLHDLGQKVYVWDEMNEDPKKWNWLINIPIDGVVTNYPETAVKYNDLKSEASSKSVNKTMTYLNNEPTPIYENPYTKNKIKGYVYNLQEYNVNKTIKIDNETYYQIGTNKFANSDSFSDSKVADRLTPYLHSSIRSIQNTKNILYTSPKLDSITKKTISNEFSYDVEGIKKDGSKNWIKINQGWLLADNLLFSLHGKDELQKYFNLPINYRLTNIDLSFIPVKSAKKDSSLPDFDFKSVISPKDSTNQI
ncbi:glycerophosphoryl diester phosphodiesterase [Companilactobacillus sp. RD055328]|uniref:glycerophosphodiester phosphodiesterase n=1 Tax=Companilactobacillus sp. RD055328 TaxID=2916634 RepID=UPI001FC8A2D6|nr:glycerophosphodiester phosphodiesterase [Companilactobacillus sp. RD055328]GKQ42085.1 glycerophosphoryl diester phosphodiesterase [Companilactobacillus sp. RD055328]